MKQHRYRVTVEHLADAQGNPVDASPLRFEVGNHDDIMAVVAYLRGRGDLPEETATAFGVGLKLFGETLLENRDHPLFAEFFPQFVAFMKHLKKGPAQS